MKCPVCYRDLIKVTRGSTEVDICPKCQGVWLDSGEIVLFIKELTESSEISPRTPHLFKPPDVKTVHTLNEPDKLCPRCNKTLQKFNYAYDSNIFLDKCPLCQGIWLDGGEAESIARYLKDDPRVTQIYKEFVKSDEDLNDLVELGKTLKEAINPAFLWLPKIVIPLYDDNPRQRFPLVTLLIVLLNILIYITCALQRKDARLFIERFALVPKHFFGIGLFTSMFLHSGLIHLLGNMFFLWIFGDNVEDRFTRGGYLIFYLMCGLAASALFSIMHSEATLTAIGASGAISGIMGAYFVFYPKVKIKTFFIYKIIRVPVYIYLGAWFLLQLLYASIYRSLGFIGGIAWFAHIGGFVFGGVVALFKKRFYKAIRKGDSK